MNEFQINDEERTFALLCHLGGLGTCLFPFGNIVAPLIFWILKRERSSFVNANGKAALNFQISFTIYLIVSVVLCLVFIGAFLVLAFVLFDMVCIALASIAAYKGKVFKYPLSIPFLK